MTGADKHFYRFKSFRLDVEERQLLHQNLPVPLTPKAFDVLAMLVERNGHLVEKDELMNSVWADSFVEEQNITRIIHTLRRSLGEDENGNKFIETVAKKGYRFVAKVHRIEEEAEPIYNETAVHSEPKQFPTQKFPHRIEHPEMQNRGTVVALADWRRETGKNQPEESNGQVAKLELIPTNPVIKHKPKHRRFIAFGLIFTALAGIGYGLFNYLFRHKTPRIFQAGQVTRLTSSGRVKKIVISPDGNFTIYVQEENGGRQSLWMQHVGSESNVQIVPSSAVEYRVLSITPNGNSIYYIDEKQSVYQIPVLGGTAKKIAENLLLDSGIGFSPDGKQFTFVRRLEDNRSALFTINSDGTNEQKVATFEPPMRLQDDPAWSPNGKIIACPVLIDGLFKILAIEIADGKTSLVSEGWNVIRKLVWLSDSNSLIFIGTVKGNFHQLFQISYPHGEAKQITSDLNNYDDFSLSLDDSSLAAVKVEQTAHLWTTPSSDISRVREITSGFEKFDGIHSLQWMSDSKILYTSSPSSDISIWTIEANGDNPKQLLKEGHYPQISPDHRFIVYRNRVGSELALLRMDLSDGSEKLLTTGIIHYPTFSPDGKWVVFTKYNNRMSLWKVPVKGGEPIQILVESALCAAVSPDGKTIAFVLRRGGNPNRIALVSMEGGEITKLFDAMLETNPFSNNQNLEWTADGRGIYFIALNDGVSNIWRQPIDGSAPVQMTKFETGRIFNFAYSPDGKQLALSRGSLNSDVVLISNGD